MPRYTTKTILMKKIFASMTMSLFKKLAILFQKLFRSLKKKEMVKKPTKYQMNVPSVAVKLKKLATKPIKSVPIQSAQQNLTEKSDILFQKLVWIFLV